MFSLSDNLLSSPYAPFIIGGAFLLIAVAVTIRRKVLSGDTEKAASPAPEAPQTILPDIVRGALALIMAVLGGYTFATRPGSGAAGVVIAALGALFATYYAWHVCAVIKVREKDKGNQDNRGEGSI